MSRIKKGVVNGGGRNFFWGGGGNIKMRAQKKRRATVGGLWEKKNRDVGVSLKRLPGYHEDRKVLCAHSGNSLGKNLCNIVA